LKLVFTSSNKESIEMGINTPYRIKSIGGLGDVEAENQTQKAPYQDGSTYIGSVLEERIIPIELKITGTSFTDISNKRQVLSRIFNPKGGEGELMLELGARNLTVNVVSDFIPKFSGTTDGFGESFQRCVLQVTAHQPYWTEQLKVSQALKAFQGTFTFPFSFPIEFGISGEKTLLTNAGHVETPVTIEIQGPVVNPQVKNLTTGQVFRINRAVSNNEIIHICTNPGAKRLEVIRDGATIMNAMGWVDYTVTDFWQLVPGDNEIEYTAVAGDQDAIVAVSWHNRYTAI
jgi:hypothetical protein